MNTAEGPPPIETDREPVVDLESPTKEVTDTMFHTNIPLNQKMSAPIILVNDQQLEGGEEELDEDMATVRGMTTNRNLVVQTDAVLITQSQSVNREKTSQIHL